MATIYQPIRIQGDAFYIRVPKNLIDKKLLSADGRVYEITLTPAKDAKVESPKEQKAEGTT